MRPGPNSRRARGRNGGGGGGGGGQQRRPNALPNRNQTIDSNGPDVRIRGNVFQVYDKYMALTRDAQASGDRVMAENYQQHAEHYVRIINAMNEAYGQPHQQPGQDNRDQPGIDSDYDPLTSPPPQRREFEPRNDGGDRQQRREFEPRGENGERPQRREFEGRGEGGDRQNREGYRDREQGFREGRPPRDQGYRDHDRGQGRDQGQSRDRFGGPREGRQDFRNESAPLIPPPDLNAPQPHIQGPLESAPVETAASPASFGVDPRDQEESSVDTELGLPSSIIGRPRRGRPPRAAAPAPAPAPVEPAPPAADVPAAPVPAPQAEAAQQQPGLPGVAAAEEAPPAPKRRPGRPRKVKVAEEPAAETPSSD
jgi:hypothetical protein